jgi:hypothetical protein
MLFKETWVVHQRLRDASRASYMDGTNTKLLPRSLARVNVDLLAKRAQKVGLLSKNYLSHRFNVLGSEWSHVVHGMSCRGVEGYRYNMGETVVSDSEGRWLEGRINRQNLAESQKVWKLIDTDYVPIDWQLDFKSGYRWSERAWYLDIPYGHLLGIDIKVPWELARMYHLAQLGWAFALSSNDASGFESPECYVREFRNEVLDFIVNNPPRFGVNWCGTMDVAIRAANWLLAYDVFRAYGANFDDDFERCLARSIYEHGHHIYSNLQTDAVLKTNHYLSDIAGLLFVAGHLKQTPQTLEWLSFSIEELVREVEHQFNPDGSNFEASTCYHRLAAEIAVYATALTLGLHSQGRTVRNARFPSWYTERLEKMGEFTIHATKPGNAVIQIGDNDSGRFLKLDPACFDCEEEDHLDHRHLVDGLNGLFERADWQEYSELWLDGAVVKSLAGNMLFPSYHSTNEVSAAEVARVGDDSVWSTATTLLQSSMDMEGLRERTLRVPFGGDLYEGMHLYAYPDFGLFIFRSLRLYLAIRCGDFGQDGIGGHAHSDQLAIELNLDGIDWARDPGTYLYTPLPQRRNEYRSVKAHHAPSLDDREPFALNQGMFRLDGSGGGKCLYFGEPGFIGKHCGYGVPVFRMVRVMNDEVLIIDYLQDKDLVVLLPAARIDPITANRVPFSAGYGIRTA